MKPVATRDWRDAGQDPPIRYHEAKVMIAEPLELAEGIFLVRLPLPFALNHINLYLLDEGDAWSLVDCGLDTRVSREAWDALLASPLIAGRRVRRIIVTHHHPDHIGLGGWLARRLDAPLFMTAGELGVAGRYADPKRDVVAERTGFWREHGLPAERVAGLIERMPRYSQHVHALPQDVQLIDTASPIMLGGRTWQPIIGRGHSPEHLSLYAADEGILLSGDQVLPEITPNIGVWPGGDQNPLRSYLESLEEFSTLPGDPLVLPSHRQPLRGLQSRVNEIGRHHDERLGHVVVNCSTAMTCYELLQAMFGRPLRNEEVGFGLGEGVAHLNYLEGEGILASSIDENGARRFAVS
jgi:glyoxylase-like metal-dependent hydrolase (beta-lactamase superfamily II)